MEQAFQHLTMDMEMQELHADPRVPPNLVENLGTNPGVAWTEWARLQQHQEAENAHLFQAMAKHPKTVLEEFVVTQAQANT